MYNDRVHPLSVIAALALLSAPLPALAQEDVAAKVKAHLDAATVQARELRFGDALPHLREAWKLEKAHDTACNIGRVAMRAGEMREAAEFLTKCKEMAPPSAERAELARRAEEQRELESALRAVSALVIVVSAPGAEVLIDGERVGVSPMPSRVFVAPGARRLQAKRGDEVAEASIDAKAGEVRFVELTLAPPKKPRGPAVAPVAAPSLVPETEPLQIPLGPPASAPASAAEEPITTFLAIAAAGGFGATMGMGAGYTEVANRASDERARLWVEVQEYSYSLCDVQRSRVCNNYHEVDAEQERATVTAGVLFGTAGLIAASAVVYFIYSHASSSPPSAQSGRNLLTPVVVMW